MTRLEKKKEKKSHFFIMNHFVVNVAWFWLVKNI